MRKRCSMSFFLCVFLILSIVILLAGCTSQPADVKDPGSGSGSGAGAPIELSFACMFNPTHKGHIEISQAWGKAVEEATNGRVKVTVYPAGTLLEATDIYEGVIAGTADVGHVAIAYNIGRFPIMNALYLGGIEYKCSQVSSYVAHDLMQEFDPEELKDTKFMFVYGVSPGDLLTKSPVRTLEDIQGMEIRATGEGVRNLNLVGATPVAMPMNDAYEALSKGVIQGNLAPVEVLEGWKMAEVTNYITSTPFMYNAVHYVTMNRDVWNSLPEDIQNAINEVNEKIRKEVAAPLWKQLNESGLKYAVDNYGHEIITLPDEEKQRWLERLEPLHEEYIKSMEEKGLPGREVIERIKELAEKYNNEFH